MPDRGVKVELFDQFARVAKAVASGRRVEIVDVLTNGDRTVEELARQVGLSTANASQHLQVLRKRDLSRLSVKARECDTGSPRRRSTNSGSDYVRWLPKGCLASKGLSSHISDR